MYLKGIDHLGRLTLSALLLTFYLTIASAVTLPCHADWIRILGDPSFFDSGYGIAVDSNYNNYITGVTYGNLDGIDNNGSPDIFVWKIFNSKIRPTINAMPWFFLLQDDNDT